MAISRNLEKEQKDKKAKNIYWQHRKVFMPDVDVSPSNGAAV